MTAAATLWFVTVMGLCFGGGQVGLGLAGFVLALVTLTTLKRVEIHKSRQHGADPRITVTSEVLKQEEIASLLIHNGLTTTEATPSSDNSPELNRAHGWKIRWRGKHEDPNPPHTIQEMAAHPAVIKLEFPR